MVADARARSQLSSLLAAALVAVTLLVLTPVFGYLPQAALGAVVLVAAARMVDVAALRKLWRVRRSDFALAAATACGVLVVGVLPGIGVGVAVSLLEVLRRAVLPRPRCSAGSRAARLAERPQQRRCPHGARAARLPLRRAAVLRERGVLPDQVIKLVDAADPAIRTVVIDAEGMVDMDVTGAEAPDELMDQLDERGMRLVLARARSTLRVTLRQMGSRTASARTASRCVRDAVADHQPEAPSLHPAAPAAPDSASSTGPAVSEG
jgi:SulP family sulfate permease